MLSDKIQEAFNKQINEELFSSYLYLSMATYFESVNLKGMAHWMRLQADEEYAHAMKFLDYINERGGRVLLSKIEGPKTEWTSPLEVFKESLEHEIKVTGLINKLVELSIDKKDHASHSFLQWFVTEQVEEESTVQDIVDNLTLLDDSKVALFMMDRELGQRTAAATV